MKGPELILVIVAIAEFLVIIGMAITLAKTRKQLRKALDLMLDATFEGWKAARGAAAAKGVHNASKIKNPDERAEHLAGLLRQLHDNQSRRGKRRR